MTAWLFVLLGIGLLYGGGEALIRGAVRLAAQAGLSPMVIGLTVVAFGTSAPELAATLLAVLRGSPEIGMGNVLGSNIANIGLILPLAALITPLFGQGKFIWREIPFMFLASAVLLLLLPNDVLGRWEGLGLLSVLVGYTIYLLREKDENAAVVDEFNVEFGKVSSGKGYIVAIGLIIVGLVALVFGATLTVDGGVAIASRFGVSDRIIGLTLVAVGTSLPELASSIVAAAKKETDIVLGNIVGSNIFNVLGILGVTAIVKPIEVVYDHIEVDILVGLGFAALLLAIIARTAKIGRFGGFVLVTGYGVYIATMFG
ncbi:MAG: calcium/sodium antiporter [Myxococcales bacterium]|nr:calcium/sodium antiporter [Myxococcales bacterium]